jgi:diguanylate cyclase (GGDEF)-like protein
MPGPAENWSTQQLAEFLAVVSSFTDQRSAIRGAVERAAEALEAEVAALVRESGVEASIGFPAGEVDEAELVVVAEERRPRLEVSGVGSCGVASVPLDDTPPGRLVVARFGDDVFSQEELDLLRGMARVLALALRMLRALEEERALRKASQHEIQQRRRAEKQLAHQALHDALTGLPNRSLLVDRVEHALERAKRSSTSAAAFFVDVDNFKLVNDSLGHQAGDELLIEFADRLENVTRAADTAARLSGATVARLGGDEFVVLCEDLADERDAIRIAERIGSALDPPFVLKDGHVSITASIGIAIAKEGDTAPDSLIRDADVALYRAKEGGRDRYELFDQAMRARVLERLGVEGDLRQAIGQDELRLFYQPIVSLSGDEIVGVEALIRWQHPKRGLVLPAEFIPIAEESGLIVTIGTWVLEEACRQSAFWQVAHPDWPPLRVFVNVSARQLTGELVDVVSTILRDTGADPARLALEITESVLMEQADSPANLLQSLRDLGVWVALDDFGTGYSSLSYLQHFPLDVLKLDRSFISAPEGEATNLRIVAATIEMGRALDMNMVAEGVETKEQLEQLIDLGCDFAQGYYFARPQPAEAITALLGERFAITPRSAVPYAAVGASAAGPRPASPRALRA